MFQHVYFFLKAPANVYCREEERKKNIRAVDMKHMMVFRSELGQIFSQLLHHQQRAIKSMIVCEQWVISTPAQKWKSVAKNIFVSLLKFHFDLFYFVFPFQGFKGRTKNVCNNKFFTVHETESHLISK